LSNTQRVSSKLCELCNARDAAAMRALESLTPSGSEFVNDIERCVQFVRDTQAAQMRVIVSLSKKVKELEDLLTDM
jgi:hypothetical protein